MRIPILALLAFLFIDSSNAQNIQNGSFENWLKDTSFSLEGWQSSGLAFKTSDAVEGGAALQLKNDKSSSSFGFISTGPFINDRIIGVPYDEQPLSMRFNAKYNLALGDKAQVVALFSFKGNTLAYASFYIEGNSADTFVMFSVPISWQVSSSPDSVAIVISSIDLENNEINGDGYLIVDDFHFATISTRNKAINNGNFNSWESNISEHLSGWYTTDDYLKDLVTIKAEPPFVKKSTSAQTGNFALELTSRIIGRDTIAGVAFTGRNITEFEKPSIPISQKWKYLEGYYQYTPTNGDSGSVAVYVFKNGVPIGFGQSFFSENKTGYTYFALQIMYQVQVTPDSASILVYASNPDESRGTNSRLLVDDLKFTDQNLSVFDFNFNKLTVFPNPFKDQVRITGIDRLDGATYTIRNVNGSTVREGAVERDMQIDMRDAESGIYFLHVEGRYIRTDKILLKE